MVGDNLNVTVTPRDMRSDRQKCQLDYFQMYAVKDRIDFSEFSEEPPSVSPHPPLHELLPTGEDDKVMLSNFGILITRMLVKHIPFFSAVFSDVVAGGTYTTYYVLKGNVNKVRNCEFRTCIKITGLIIT